MKKAFFSFLRWTVWSVGTLLAAGIVAVVIYTHTPAFREWVREQAVASVNSSIHGELTIDRLEGSVWGALTLYGVRLRHREITVIEIPRLKMGYSLIPLLWGRMQIFTIEGLRPRLQIERDEAGVWNINEALAPRQPQADAGPPVVVLLNSIALKDASIDLNLSREEQKSYRLREAQLAARMQLRSGSVELEVRELASRLLAPDLPEIRVKGSLTYQDTDLRPAVEIEQLQIESGRSRARVTGRVSDFETLAIDAKIRLEKLSPVDVVRFVPEWPVKRDLQGDLSLRGAPSDLNGDLALTAGDGKISGAFHLDVATESPAYGAALDFSGFDIGQLMEMSGFNGVASGRLEAKGKGASLADLSGEVEAAIRSAEAAGWRLGDVSLAGNLRRSVVKMTGDVKGDIGSASLHGEIALSGKPQYDLALRVSDLNIRQASSLAAGPPLDGKLNFEATVQGTGLTLSEMNARARARLLPSAIGAVRLERGAITATISDNTIRLAEATVAAADATLSLQGKISADPSGQGNIDYKLRVGALAPWLALVGQDGAGSLDISGRLRGNLNRLQSEGKATLASVRLPGISFSEGQTRFQLTELTGGSLPYGTMTTSFAGVEAGIRLAKLEGSMKRSANRPYAFHLDFTARDYDGRSHGLRADADYREEEITARLTRLSLNLPDGTWNLGQPATVLKRNDNFFIDRLWLQNGARQVTLAGRFSTKGAQSLTLNVAQFPLEGVSALFSEKPWITGILSARAAISGSAAAPEISAQVDLTEAAIAGQPYAGLAATIAYKDKLARLKATLRQDPAHSLTGEGTLPVALGWSDGWHAPSTGELDFRVSSSGLRIAFLNAFTGDAVQELTGEVALDLSARGTVTKPLFEGTFRLREGGLTVNPLGIRISSLTTDGVLDGQTAILTQLSARANDGQLQGSGSVALKDYLPDNFKLSLAANRWPAIATHRYQAVVGGKIQLEGPVSAPGIAGDLEILEANLRPDLAFLEHGKTSMGRDDTIVIVRNTSGASEVETQAANGAADSVLYRNLRLNLNVTAPRNAWLRHRNANAELSGNLRATKKRGGALALAGNIDVVRGWAGFQGRRFNLSRGKVIFTGAEEINPSLDLLAQYRLRSYVVEAVVTGTVDEPQLNLRSRPQLEQADILALLLFGKPTAALNRSEQFSLQQSALNLTSGFAASRIANAVSQALGLEQLGVDIADVDFSGGRVGVGRYVSQNAYVSASQELVGERGREFSLEYDLAPDWKLRTSTGSDGTNGVDVFWHKQY